MHMTTSTMNETNTNVPDGFITIAQALKRLADKAPARNSIYLAAKRGKIEKYTGGSDKILVCWESVLRYIEGGGFKRRGMRERDKAITGKATTALPIAIVPSPTDLNAGGSNGIPATVPAAQSAHEVQVKSEPNSTTPRHTKGGRNPSVQPVTTLNRPAKPLAEERPRSRRMKATKNSLRGLNFDETKEIRDWLDNRLFHVLRPDKALTTA